MEKRMQNTLANLPLKKSGLIRKLGPGDAKGLEEHLLRLGPEARRMRFNAVVSDSFISTYAQNSFGAGCVAHGYFEDGDLRALAELRTDGGWMTHEAEAAFSVEADWRQRGIGTELFARILRSARNRGITKLMISCLSWNAPMRGLAQKFHAELHLEEGEIIGTILPERASAASLVDEVVQDGLSYVAALRQAGLSAMRPRK